MSSSQGMMGRGPDSCSELGVRSVGLHCNWERHCE